MDANFRVAALTGGAAILASAVTALGLLTNTYFSTTLEKQKAELELVRFAAGPTSQIAYCNLLVWKSAGLLTADIADRAATALKDQRKKHVTDDCDF